MPCNTSCYMPSSCHSRQPAPSSARCSVLASRLRCSTLAMTRPLCSPVAPPGVGFRPPPAVCARRRACRHCLSAPQSTRIRRNCLSAPQSTRIRRNCLSAPQSTRIRRNCLSAPQSTRIRRNCLSAPQSIRIRRNCLSAPQSTRIRRNSPQQKLRFSVDAKHRASYHQLN